MVRYVVLYIVSAGVDALCIFFRSVLYVRVSPPCLIILILIMVISAVASLYGGGIATATIYAASTAHISHLSTDGVLLECAP